MEDDDEVKKEMADCLGGLNLVGLCLIAAGALILLFY